MSTQPIEIQLSKVKLFLLLLGSLAFVGIGIWLITDPPTSYNPILGNPTLILIAGIASIGFFGFTGYVSIKKLADNTPGLIISDEGVFDNSSGIPAGFIPWTDVVAIKETQVVNQAFINIVVRNPEEHIARQTSAFTRRAMQMNYKAYGTVVGISANSLQCNHQELKILLEKKLSEYKRTAESA